MKTRRRRKVAQQFAFIYRIIVIIHHRINENLCKFHSIKHSRNNQDDCVVNEIRVEIEITLKSKMRRRCINNAS